MNVRILTWSTTAIVGLLLTGAGVHLFRCKTDKTLVQYGDESFFQYYCPVETGTHDILLTVPVTESRPTKDAKPPSWGQPSPNVTISLYPHNVHSDRITLSGFSAGGTFAQQMLVSHSSLFSGIASFSHAYYRCGPADGREATYDNACTIIGTNQTYNPELAIADIRNYEAQQLIDPTENLRNKRLYLYAGTRSEFFDLDLSLAAVRIFEPFLQNHCAIKTRVQDATQLLPTANFGQPCNMPSGTQNYFLGNCGLSGAYDALEFLLAGGIRSPPPAANYRSDPAYLLQFDQSEFFFGFEGPHFMDNVGYIYIPRQCYEKKCLLHFYFHGCLTGREFNGTQHLINSGYLEVADTNDIIIVAPQAVGNQENMIGCWDTYGLTGNLYATKRGSQVTTVRNMIARILGDDNRIRRETGGSSTDSVISNTNIIYPAKSIETVYEEYNSYQAK